MSKKVSGIEKTIKNEYKRLKYKTDILGPGSLMTKISGISASRGIMLNNQQTHRVDIRGAEPARLSTGFEDVLGQYSFMIDESDGDYVLVDKFEKNMYTYVAILYDKKRRHFHAKKREEVEEFSEGFASRYRNPIDNMEIGDVIHKGDLIAKPECLNKFGNYCMGKNLNTVYLVTALTHEDGITLMNGAEEMMNVSRKYEVELTKNSNQVFLNLYGGKDKYKCFPDIGEEIKRGKLCAIRTVDNSKAPYALKGKYLRQIEEGDKVRSVKGTVIDVDIRYNGSFDSLTDSVADAQINKLYKEQQEYYFNLYKYMKSIIDNADDDNYTYSDEFSIICEEAHKYVDATAYFIDEDDSTFGNMRIKFTIIDDEPMSIGSKMVGRAGNKGVVCNIIPKEKSWTMEDGRPIHVVISALGVVGRLNHMQLDEHSINELGDTVVRMMRQVESNKEKMKLVYQFLDIVNKDESKELRKYYDKLTDKEQDKFVKKIEKNGIIVITDPIDGPGINEIEEAYKQFEPCYQHIMLPGRGKTLRKVLCAPLYFYRLKQDPLDKYSARSRGPVNPLYSLPAKSNLKKQYLELYSDVAVRLGTAEIDVLSICNTPYAISDYMAANSTSIEAKEQLAQLYSIDPSEELYIEDCTSTQKKNREIIDAYTGVLGSLLVFEYEDAPPGQYFSV